MSTEQQQQQPQGDTRDSDEVNEPVQGRRAHSAWMYFTNTEAPWREKSAPCKHCGVVVSYNKKNENVQRHLRHCNPFLESIRQLPPSELPGFVEDYWLEPSLKKKARTTGTSTSGGSTSSSSGGGGGASGYNYHSREYLFRSEDHHHHHHHHQQYDNYSNSDSGDEAVASGGGSGVATREESSSFSIEIKHPEFKFNASHFIAISDGTGYREKLHGHNYTVIVKMKGSCPPLSNGYLVDFSEVKKVVRTICKEEFNERFICPMLSSALSISSTSLPSLPTITAAAAAAAATTPYSEQIQITCEDGSYFSFPKGDVVCLPIRHSSVEELSRYMWCEIIKHIGAPFLVASGVTSMSVGVAENPHQTAFFTRSVPRFPANCSSFEYPTLLRNELNNILHHNNNHSSSYQATSCSNYVNILTNLKDQVDSSSGVSQASASAQSVSTIPVVPGGAGYGNSALNGSSSGSVRENGRRLSTGSGNGPAIISNNGSNGSGMLASHVIGDTHSRSGSGSGSGSGSNGSGSGVGGLKRPHGLVDPFLQ